MKHLIQQASSCMLMIAIANTCLADTPINPIHETTVCSSDGKYCFHSAKDPAKTTISLASSPKEVIWSTNEFVTNGYIADNGTAIASCYPGNNLVPSDATLDFVIARILKKDRPAENISLKELYTSMDQLPKTISHREWGRCIGIVKNRIALERADGTTWEKSIP